MERLGPINIIKIIYKFLWFYIAKIYLILFVNLELIERKRCIFTKWRDRDLWSEENNSSKFLVSVYLFFTILYPVWFFFIQVNTGLEDQKSGLEPKHVRDFSSYCSNDLKLNIIGLMCIPPINDKPKTHFKLIETLAKENNVNELSIGMSNDYQKALEFNPTYIRLGTILFGKRWQKVH